MDFSGTATNTTMSATNTTPCNCQDHNEDPANDLIRKIGIYYTLAAVLVIVILFGFLMRAIKKS